MGKLLRKLCLHKMQFTCPQIVQLLRFALALRHIVCFEMCSNGITGCDSGKIIILSVCLFVYCLFEPFFGPSWKLFELKIVSDSNSCGNFAYADATTYTLYMYILRWFSYLCK